MVGSMEFGLQQHVQTFCDNAVESLAPSSGTSIWLPNYFLSPSTWGLLAPRRGSKQIEGLGELPHRMLPKKALRHSIRSTEAFGGQSIKIYRHLVRVLFNPHSVRSRPTCERWSQRVQGCNLGPILAGAPPQPRSAVFEE